MDVTLEKQKRKKLKPSYTPEFRKPAVKRVKDVQGFGVVAKELGLVELNYATGSRPQGQANSTALVKGQSPWMRGSFPCCTPRIPS